jgi:MFS family permease
MRQWGELDDQPHDAYGAMRLPDFRLLMTSNFLTSVAQAVLSVLIGWELYERTGSALALGLVGLVQIIPNVAVALPAGQYVDRHDQKRIAVLATALHALATLTLTILSATTGPLVLIYAALFVTGLARAFRSATRTALLAAIVPQDRFANAAAWSSSANQTAAVIGPALGGVAIVIVNDTATVFAGATGLLLIATLALIQTHPRPIARMTEEVSFDSLFAGIRFIWRTKVLMAAITLDMVGVLLGGATALLPIFAEDVLHVGATGLGLMRAAPAAGAMLMSLLIVRHGPFQRAGPTLLLAVAGFGVATILFGLSRSLPLSLLALGLLGGFDAISMVIRHTMQLTYTPDDMRGRVSSVHHLFVGMSNEFGEFESGVLAALVGATAAVIFGGVGTLIVVPLIALAWPEVWRLRRIEATPSPPAAAAVPTHAVPAPE